MIVSARLSSRACLLPAQAYRHGGGNDNWPDGEARAFPLPLLLAQDDQTRAKSIVWPILRDARLRRAPQDEVFFAAKSQNLMVRSRICAASRTMRPRLSPPKSTV